MKILTFREATPSDTNDLLALEQKVIEAERPFNSAIKDKNAHYYNIPELISSSNSHLLVAENNSEIIATGYIQIRQSKPSLQHASHGYLGFMFVLPQFRGQGINKTILDKLISWGSINGITDFYLDVYASNQAAIKAYQKVGFTPSLLEMKLDTKVRT